MDTATLFRILYVGTEADPSCPSTIVQHCGLPLWPLYALNRHFRLGCSTCACLLWLLMYMYIPCNQLLREKADDKSELEALKKQVNFLEVNVRKELSDLKDSVGTQLSEITGRPRRTTIGKLGDTTRRYYIKILYGIPKNYKSDILFHSSGLVSSG